MIIFRALAIVSGRTAARKTGIPMPGIKISDAGVMKPLNIIPTTTAVKILNFLAQKLNITIISAISMPIIIWIGKLRGKPPIAAEVICPKNPTIAPGIPPSNKADR